MLRHQRLNYCSCLMLRVSAFQVWLANELPVNLICVLQKLEEEFQRQFREQERFYGTSVAMTTTCKVDETVALRSPGSKQQHSHSSIVF
jgi:hypothetical protein